MAEMQSYPPSTFCWVELGTTDVAAAKRFYGEICGWSAEDLPMGDGGAYTFLKTRGKEVAAAYALSQEMRAQGVPPHWRSYVAVASADESAKKAAGLGGKVMAPPFDVMDVGRMAVIQDPTGATFALWEAKKHIGARLVMENGALSWNELSTHDTGAAKRFYTSLFGWDTRTLDAGPFPYTTFMRGEQGVGGMMQLDPKWGKVPPSWMPYFGVPDCDKSAEKVRTLGGQIRVPPTDIPNMTSRFAVIQDPQGAVFGIIRF